MSHDELPDEVLEALAAGREDLVPAEWLQRLQHDVVLRERVSAERALSIDVGLLLRDAAPPLDAVSMEALVARAMSARPVSNRSLVWAGLAGGLCTVALAMAGRIPTVPDLYRGLRTGWALVAALGAVAAQVPGGAGTIAFGAALLTLLLAWPARRLLGAGSSPAALGLAIAIASFGGVASVGGVAHAQRFEGDWPNDARVTLDVDDRPLPEVVRLAAEAAGLGVATSLREETDETVSLHVRDASLRDVLEALLTDPALVVRRTDAMLVIRAESPAQSPAPAPPTQVDGPAALPPAADTRPAHDRFSMGEDVTIDVGQRVKDLVTMGGDAVIRGEVLGDVTTMGGDVTIEGLVRGDLVTMGGDVEILPGGAIMGEVHAMGGEVSSASGSANEAREESSSEPETSGIEEAFERASRYGLLFLLGLLLLGPLRQRHARMARAMVDAPARLGVTGLLALLSGALLTVALVITLVGIPAALVVAVGAFLGLYVGVAVAGSVIGSALPLTALEGRPVARLAAGVVLMLAISFIPFFGTLAMAVIACVGFGAVVSTRFGRPE